MTSGEFFYDFGKREMGPLLVGMTNWLINCTRNDDLIIFQSRGAYWLWILYQMMKPAGAPPGVIQYASRLVKDDTLRRYIRSLVGDAKKVATVDTGWYGSMQDRQAAATGVKVHGYYFGTMKRTCEGKSGYCFENWWDWRRRDIHIWETLLNMLAVPGTVKAIHELNGQFRFDFGSVDYNPADAEHYRAGVIAAVQTDHYLTPKEANAKFHRIHYHPTEDEKQFLGAIPNHINWKPNGFIRDFWHVYKKQ